ncbi:MAG TPA: ABC transporter ATP-binding protein [Virgibacillus sp.]|nr:ABC transporter ATP-binding protein [Virgibacillus sp.]
MVQAKHKLLKINDITKSFHKTEIIAPFSHTLQRGNILALCGGNGAGKSTLIRMITGLIKPTTGSISLNGYDLNKDRKKYMQMFGYMPDDFNFQKSISAKETIQFYANLKKVDRHRMMKVIEAVGLSEHLNKKVQAFSKGMKQRLLLAQALLSEPKLLILDEPTNGLDPYWIKQFSELMLAARNNGQTVIFSTHDLHVAEEIADEVVFLNAGKVISKGPIHTYRDTGLYQTFQQLYFSETT